MNIITRRQFLKQKLQLASGIAMGSMMGMPMFMRQAAASTAPLASTNGNKLIFIFLRGGNDALNTVIPVGDSAYSPIIRPNLYIPGPSGGLGASGLAPVDPDPTEAIDLGNSFAALHPSLRDLIPLYNEGELAVLHRVGYPDQSRSHFDSEKYWETGVPSNDSLNEGIFYRTIVERGLHESLQLPAITWQSNMPVSLRGDLPLANINDPLKFDLLGVYGAARIKHLESIARMHGKRHPDKSNRSLLFPTGDRMVKTIQELVDVDFTRNGRDLSGKITNSPFLDDDINQTHLFPVDSDSDDKGFNSNNAYNFFKSLKYSAQVLEHTDAIISGTELNGFDTHNVQGGDNGGIDGNHADLMARLGWGMYALKKYLTNVGMWDKTLIVTMSEFGRTTVENGSLGTDHAEAGAMFIAGGAPALNGGVYQCDGNSWAPGDQGAMFEINGRYLSRTTDYRSVLGEIIRDHLGASPAELDRIIPGYANPAENLFAGGQSLDEHQIVGELGLLT